MKQGVLTRLTLGLGAAIAAKTARHLKARLALAGLLTLPFAWHPPTELELTKLIAIGVIAGVAHILLTEGYRFAPASLLAPFDYTAMVWAFVLGYAIFGETPTPLEDESVARGIPAVETGRVELVDPQRALRDDVEHLLQVEGGG